MVLKAILIIITSYLVGSIPFGLIVGKIGYGIDIRTRGSGNIGTTNIFRILGAFPGIVVLIGDMSKGVGAVVLARLLFPEVAVSSVDASVVVLAGMVVILGHNWSVYLKFSGGKGIATGFGVLISLVPYITLILLLIWLATLVTSRHVSLASVVTASFFPFFTVILCWGNYPYILFSIVSSFVVIYKHRSNIGRLLRGEEPKINKASLRKEG